MDQHVVPTNHFEPRGSLPANDDKPTYDLTGSWDGFVIRNGRGHVVAHASTLTIAARKLAELQERAA